jgi:hypothetical protein
MNGLSFRSRTNLATASAEGMARPPKRAAENQELLGDWLLTYRTGERVRDDFDRPLQCLEPPLAIASMRPLARMAEDVALDILFDGG